MKFIGGPAHGQLLPEWVRMQRPTTVIVTATGPDSPPTQGWARVTAESPSHTYLIQEWSRGRVPFLFYAHSSLTADEIKKRSMKEFS